MNPTCHKTAEPRIKWFVVAGTAVLCGGLLAQDQFVANNPAGAALMNPGAGNDAVTQPPLAIQFKTPTRPTPQTLLTNWVSTNWMWRGTPLATVITRSGNAQLFNSGKIGTNRALRGTTPLQPGVYQAEPYSMIVLVPPPYPDDKMVAGRRELSSVGEPAMPIIKPELRFIPRTK